MALTNSEKSVMLNLAMGSPGSGVAATYHMALFTAMPTASTPGTEVSGGSYGRVAITNNTTSFPASTGGANKANGVAFTFPTATAPWGECVGWGFFDASSGGTLRHFGPLSPAIDVGTGVTVVFGVGGFSYSAA